MSDLKQGLIDLGLAGMARAFDAQMADPESARLPFEDRLMALVSEEMSFRMTRRYERIIKDAGFRVAVHPSQLQFDETRGLSEAFGRELLKCNWISQRQKIVISGATGTGKTWLACGLGMAAAIKGHAARYFSAQELYEALIKAATLSRAKVLRAKLLRLPLLIIDDFGLHPMPEAAKADFFALIEGREESKSTLFAGQLPFDKWHDYIDQPTLADALLDRIRAKCHFIDLTGDSMRKPL